MKKLLVAVFALFLFANISNAQNQDSIRKSKVRERVSNMDTAAKHNLGEKGLTKKNYDELDLNADQQRDMGKIHREAREQRLKIQNDNSLTEAQKEERLSKLRQEEKKKADNVLTKEQREKVQKRNQHKRKKDGTTSSPE